MFGIKINFKKGGTKVVELPKPYEYRKTTPVFALTDKDGTNLLTAAQIRGNWNAWAKDYFSYPNGEPSSERITPEEAEKRGWEVL